MSNIPNHSSSHCSGTQTTQLRLPLPLPRASSIRQQLEAQQLVPTAHHSSCPVQCHQAQVPRAQLQAAVPCSPIPLSITPPTSSRCSRLHTQHPQRTLPSRARSRAAVSTLTLPSQPTATHGHHCSHAPLHCQPLHNRRPKPTAPSNNKPPSVRLTILPSFAHPSPSTTTSTSPCITSTFLPTCSPRAIDPTGVPHITHIKHVHWMPDSPLPHPSRKPTPASTRPLPHHPLHS